MVFAILFKVLSLVFARDDHEVSSDPMPSKVLVIDLRLKTVSVNQIKVFINPQYLQN